MMLGGMKNFSLSGVATDLGLGDMTKVQLDDEETERKKKLMQAKGPMGFGDQLMGSAASMLLGRGY